MFQSDASYKRMLIENVYKMTKTGKTNEKKMQNRVFEIIKKKKKELLLLILKSYSLNFLTKLIINVIIKYKNLFYFQGKNFTPCFQKAVCRKLEEAIRFLKKIYNFSRAMPIFT